MKVKWSYFRDVNKFICIKCDGLMWEFREICERCGEKNTLRKITKYDFKKWKANR